MAGNYMATVLWSCVAKVMIRVLAFRLSKLAENHILTGSG